MVISEDKVVSVAYELKYNKENSPIIEKVEVEKPMTFIFGSGNLLKDFEANLKNLKTGDSFDFVLTSEQAYGPRTEEAKVQIPINAFEVNGKIDENLLKVGNQVPMMDQAGNRLNGIVLEINDEHVKMDFNHPLAGEDLHFKGVVAEIREATEEEKSHGHIHAHSSCGCDSGECSTEDSVDSCGCGC
ncbi:MAG: peptidylprolyl isomerase [Chlorobi bacterium]|nr:peptidylprolyl isomerase [Chlorobiota bacterium]